MLIAILACETAFWIFLLGGLVIRYGPGRRRPGVRRVSTPLLAMAGGAIALMAVITGYDLATGGSAELAHILAAIGVAIGLVSGRHHLNTADRWVRRRLGEHQPKVTEPKRDRLRRVGLEWVVAIALFGIGWALTGFDETRSAALYQGAQLWTLISGIDVIWILSERRRRPEPATTPVPDTTR